MGDRKNNTTWYILCSMCIIVVHNSEKAIRVKMLVFESNFSREAFSGFMTYFSSTVERNKNLILYHISKINFK
jgi:hypothetical protein